MNFQKLSKIVCFSLLFSSLFQLQAKELLACMHDHCLIVWDVHTGKKVTENNLWRGIGKRSRQEDALCFKDGEENTIIVVADTGHYIHIFEWKQESGLVCKTSVKRKPYRGTIVSKVKANKNFILLECMDKAQVYDFKGKELCNKEIGIDKRSVAFIDREKPDFMVFGKETLLDKVNDAVIRNGYIDKYSFFNKDFEKTRVSFFPGGKGGFPAHCCAVPGSYCKFFVFTSQTFWFNWMKYGEYDCLRDRRFYSLDLNKADGSLVDLFGGYYGSDEEHYKKRSVDCDFLIKSVSVCYNDSPLVSILTETSLSVFDLKDQTVIFFKMFSEKNNCLLADFSGFEQEFAILCVFADGTIRKYDVLTGEILKTCTLEGFDALFDLRNCVYCYNGNRAVREKDRKDRVEYLCDNLKEVFEGCDNSPMEISMSNGSNSILVPRPFL